MWVEDLMCARKLLKEITGNALSCTILHVHNQSTIPVVTEHGNYQRIKRFAKKSRKIAKFVKKENIAVQYVSSEANIADIFTKALGPTRFQSLQKALIVEDVAMAAQVHTE
ncbi:hypothetical protein PC128_g22852 [Phytophthora cactorum]|nr:hypothetical protein PC120_g23077 [Phytophthora cactorum]KAG3044768.1 hypothetical protein PC121_g21711 [Phytophthora cactorum]KAG3152065.1 hypothetical protein PC128_g22852 [Phytophthora cactorum]KAG4040867.1 hypothetical protein PC123_g23601 [Phytophthora cactorum]